MPRFPSQSALRIASAAVVLASAGACSTAESPADSAGAAPAAQQAASTAAPADGMGGHDMSTMSGMANITGDPDRDFLRMMSDHHKGLIQMAHMTKDRKASSATTVADATKLDATQDTELDHMVTMLETDFKDAYAPQVLPAHKAMADQLRAKSGSDFDRTFYQNTIAHHQEALKMIDEYSPKLKNAMLKQMAASMRADQAKEIAEYQLKVSKLGT